MLLQAASAMSEFDLDLKWDLEVHTELEIFLCL
jgi:hypothetical protein